MPDERVAPTVRLRMSKLFLVPEALKAFARQILQFCGRPADSSYFGRENWTRNNHCVLLQVRLPGLTEKKKQVQLRRGLESFSGYQTGRGITPQL